MVDAMQDIYIYIYVYMYTVSTFFVPPKPVIHLAGFHLEGRRQCASCHTAKKSTFSGWELGAWFRSEWHQGEGVFLGNPKHSVWEDWSTLGKIRGITTPRNRILLVSDPKFSGDFAVFFAP